MALPNRFLLFLFSTIIVSGLFSSCSNAYEENPQEINSIEPDGFVPVNDGKLKDFIKSRTDVLSLNRGSVKTSISVSQFGAKGDGTSDDTQAFVKAWKRACGSSKPVALVVPKGKTYLMKPVRFSGPCKSAITMQIYGTIKASNDPSDYKKDKRHWLVFDGVNNLSIDGGTTGTIDGNGHLWWKNSCKINKAKPCKSAPTALTLYKSNKLRVNSLKIRNAQQIQVSFERCSDVKASNLQVTAPEDSPNTDGIHITATRNIHVTNSVIATGDDCISIESGSRNVRAEGITCGPGHGISIGSLGDGNSKAFVSGVIVNGAKFKGTDNGVRIKTWQGGSGIASNIRFQNIRMENVKNPIIIDQNYCDQDEPCKQQKSAVQIKNVVYQNITGTSATDVAVKIDCSKSHPCRGILMQNVNLKGGKATCRNAKITAKGSVSPSCGRH